MVSAKEGKGHEFQVIYGSSLAEESGKRLPTITQ